MRFWLGVVSKEHVQIGVQNNFVQVCHGKSAPLKRMQKDDWFIYYSPVSTFQGKDKLQAFTGIGKIRTGEVYQYKMYEGFEPFRIDVDFIDMDEVAFSDVKSKLELARGNLGLKLRRGHVEISKEDFEIIYEVSQIKRRTS